MSRHVSRFIETRLQLIFEDRAKHDVNIDISFLGMSKCARQSADNLETELLPKTDRGCVGRNDKIKLHCAKTKVSRFIQAMLGHGAANSLALRAARDHECRIGNMRTGTRLIRS